jgi:hypothetical protein
MPEGVASQATVTILRQFNVAPLSWARDKEVFENKPCFAPKKGAPARTAGYFGVVCRGGFHPNNLIEGSTVGTFEGRRPMLGHSSFVSDFVAN